MLESVRLVRCSHGRSSQAKISERSLKCADCTVKMDILRHLLLDSLFLHVVLPLNLSALLSVQMAS